MNAKQLEAAAHLLGDKKVCVCMQAGRPAAGAAFKCICHSTLRGRSASTSDISPRSSPPPPSTPASHTRITSTQCQGGR